MNIVTFIIMVMFAISVMSAIDSDRYKRQGKMLVSDAYLIRSICFTISGYLCLSLNSLLL